MKMQWNDFDADTLKTIYEKESANLKTALIGGTAWNDLKEQRQKVTELSIALHKKIYSSPNPAESTDRTQKRTQH